MGAEQELGIAAQEFAVGPEVVSAGWPVRVGSRELRGYFGEFASRDVSLSGAAGFGPLRFDVGYEVPDRVLPVPGASVLTSGESQSPQRGLGCEQGEDEQVEQDESAQLNPEHDDRCAPSLVVNARTS
ncbi:hypothetical protein [Saccharopolyspora hirsuta]|uniref:hypothetical protein n=1 Tax=Saccharopolyspora hirsuta TaxID=1837 RepID=UPI0014786348|nr:hypothetical protein [Saccharopolyspora hirsuta]